MTTNAKQPPEHTQLTDAVTIIARCNPSRARASLVAASNGMFPIMGSIEPEGLALLAEADDALAVATRELERAALAIIKFQLTIK